MQLTNGRRAIHWDVEQQFSSICLLKCRLEREGRKIRVHLSSRVPIETLYGKSPRHLLTKLGDPLKNALLKFKRQALHAMRWAFHPGRGTSGFSPSAPMISKLLNLLSKDCSKPVPDRPEIRERGFIKVPWDNQLRWNHPFQILSQSSGEPS